MDAENFGLESWVPDLRGQATRGTIAIYRLRYPLTGLYLLLVALAALTGDRLLHRSPPLPDQSAQASTVPSRDSLVAEFWESRKLMFVYGSEDPAVEAQYKAFLASKTEGWDYLEVAIRSDEEVKGEDLGEWMLYLVGTPRGNSLMASMMPDLPFAIAGDSLVFNGKSYRESPIFSLNFYPRKDRPNMAVSAFAGMTDASVLEFMSRQHWRWFSTGSWGYQVVNDDVRVVMGQFEQQKGHEWEIGGELHWDYSDPPREYGQFENLRMLVHDPGIPERVLDSAGRELQALIEKAEAFQNGKRKAPVLNFHVFATAENKGLQTGNTRQAHMEEWGVYQSLAPEFQGFANGEPLRQVLRKFFGKPALMSMETGLSIYLTDNWQGKGWEYWAALLHRSGNGMPLSELVDDQYMQAESPLVSGCMAAAMVAFLLEKYGKEEFLSAYSSFLPDAGRTKMLSKEFEPWLDKLVSRKQAEFPSRRSMTEALPPYQKGFNFAHEGYQIYNGYISSASTRSLAYTAENLHCNATAIIPYTGMEDPHRPSYLPFADGSGTENDESVVHCLWGARQTGLKSLLKPQVWLHKGWPGSVEMNSEKDWQEFFGYYYRWMRHYALLAEMHGADALCVGVEFQEATLKRPNDWRKLIRQMKGIYSGPLTYAANWGREFEGVDFWDELDFIGLNCYYPLSDKENANEKDLDRGFAEVMDKVGKVAEKWNKKVVFTEIGFPSIASAWKEPHAEPEDKPASAEDQARCYSAMIRALDGRDWCGGVYLWKWPAHPKSDGGRELQRGFTPKGKPAEAMVRDWFERI